MLYYTYGKKDHTADAKASFYPQGLRREHSLGQAAPKPYLEHACGESGHDTNDPLRDRAGGADGKHWCLRERAIQPRARERLGPNRERRRVW